MPKLKNGTIHPQIGETVHYRDKKGKDHAAIITELNDDKTVSLEVFGGESKRIEINIAYDAPGGGMKTVWEGKDEDRQPVNRHVPAKNNTWHYAEK